jgi:ArsR family transcriptional regulator, arsenate/arsenite/antimonite-responsive transcriptional repressor
MKMTVFSKSFRAMSDENRQKILLLLEERDRCVGELVALFDLSQPAVSKHLTVLKNAGLVNDRRCGQQVIYSLHRENLQNCCFEFFKNFQCCNSLFTKAGPQLGLESYDEEVII